MSPRRTPERRTIVTRVSPENPDPSELRAAARCLASGGLVAFPTETVYGLGADATNGPAVVSIYEAKERPPDNPLIVHIASWDELRPLVREVGRRTASLAEAFWPGPLSLVLPRSEVIAPEVCCGLETVAVRMPAHPVALELIRWAGVPVAAPSANISGRPSPTRAEDVIADLSGRIDHVLDAGPCAVGVESTVLDLTGPVPVVLRPGGVSLEDLRRVVGDVCLATGPDATPARSPGLRHRHYRPQARVFLVLPGPSGPGTPAVAEELRRIARVETGEGRRVGVTCTVETAIHLSGSGLTIRTWGSRDRAGEVAAGLYAALRDLDRAGVDSILAEGLRSGGLGLAVNDRLGRAAETIVKVGDGLVSPLTDQILLVCTGNTCRSPMAEVILTHLLDVSAPRGAFEVVSAGTTAADGQPPSPEALEVMRESGLDLSRHRSRQVTAEMVTQARLVLTMTRRHRETLIGLFPEAADRVHTLRSYAGTVGPGSEEDICDPLGSGVEAYRQAAGELRRAAEKTAERLLNPPDIGREGRDAENRDAEDQDAENQDAENRDAESEGGGDKR